MGQDRNDGMLALLMANITGRADNERAAELGDFGVYNGQFELADPYEDDNPLLEMPDGWETRSQGGAPATCYAQRVTGGVAGNYAFRGGNTGTGVGPRLVGQKFFAVDEDRDYYISWAQRASIATASLYIGVACFNAAKVYLGAAWAFTGTVTVAWQRKQKRLGPNGNNPFAANTRYVKIFAYVQNNAALNNAWVEVDDVQFQQMKGAYSAGIHLVVDQTESATAYTLPAAAVWTIDPQAILSITLEEEGWIHVHYDANSYHTAAAARNISHACMSFIGGVGCQIRPAKPSPATWAAYYDCMNLSGVRGPFVAGTYQVDFRWYLYNAADTLRINRRHASCWYSRQY